MRCRRPIPALHCLLVPLVLLSVLAAKDVSAAVIVVDTLADADAADGFCSLREAIAAAEANAPYQECAGGSGATDHINVVVTGTIALASDLPAIHEPLALVGPGWSLLTLDGQHAHRPLLIALSAPGRVVIRDLSLANGLGSGGSGGCVVAVNANATLSLRDMTIHDCVTTSGGGGVHAGGPLEIERVWFYANEAQTHLAAGGAVSWSGDRLEIRDSTFSGNRATGAPSHGGALLATGSGTAEITRSTFTGNRSNGFGGALFFSIAGAKVLDFTLRDSTLLGNEADFDGDSTEGNGGTIFFNVVSGGEMTAQLANSILAGGIDHTTGTPCPEIRTSTSLNALTLTSLGFNLIADSACVTSEFPASPGAGLANGNGDFVGTAGSPLDPRLEALGAWGGPTPTHRPRIEDPHPVVDKGSCPGAPRDQRGRVDATSGLRAHDVAIADNPDGDGCDIGAVELGAVDPAEPPIFGDGFESGTALDWSGEVP